MAFEFIQQLVNATRPDNREGRLPTMLRKRQRRRPEAMMNAYLNRDTRCVGSTRFEFPGGRGGFGL